ncbi:MAG: aminotransferase class V-fold PLP-dependent enzyme [Chitinophagaceae bacterium]|nr:aminotransferase class V-fold PLP-dependent enzyme [Chitinophagaceae bacterium]
MLETHCQKILRHTLRLYQSRKRLLRHAAQTRIAGLSKNIEKANKQGARFARKEYPAIAANVKKELAQFLKVADEEIIITRNATEALNIAIQGYPFKPGDEVLLNQLDYFSMIETFQLLQKRGQLIVKAFDMPLLPATDDEIVEVYKQQLTPKTKVILLTHVSNINGLIVPVAKIAAMARQRGIDIICDAAHALGHIPFSLPDLGAAYVGLNLHKWIGNPVGAGVLYIKKKELPPPKPCLAIQPPPMLISASWHILAPHLLPW